jgi:hypothetical protein
VTAARAAAGFAYEIAPMPVRYEHEFAVRSRPEGQILVLEIAVTVCGPAFCLR